MIRILAVRCQATERGGDYAVSIFPHFPNISGKSHLPVYFLPHICPPQPPPCRQHVLILLLANEAAGLTGRHRTAQKNNHLTDLEKDPIVISKLRYFVAALSSSPGSPRHPRHLEDVPEGPEENSPGGPIVFFVALAFFIGDPCPSLELCIPFAFFCRFSVIFERFSQRRFDLLLLNSALTSPFRIFPVDVKWMGTI